MISPDIKSHADLQADVTEFLSQQEFLVASAAYHDVMEEDAINRLKGMRNPTALNVRTRSDRIAIHKRLDLSFKLEFKSHSGGKWHNLAVEALPLAVHRAEAALGTACIYIYRDPHIEVEGAFWADDDLQIEKLIVPKKWESLTDLLKPHFPGVPIKTLDYVVGSGDPFVIIKQSDLSKVLTDWRTEIIDQIALVERDLPNTSSCPNG